MKSEVKKYLECISEGIDSVSADDILKLVELIENVRRKERSIYIIGNGGSAATSMHFACDLTKNANSGNELKIKAFSLLDNTSLISAYSNDIHYDDCLSEQVKSYLQAGDLLISISCSGNSKNLIKAVEAARQKKATTFALLGCDGGKLKEKADAFLCVSSEDYGIIETVHSAITHLATKILKGDLQ